MTEGISEGPPDPFLNPAAVPVAKTAYDLFSALVAQGFDETRAERIMIALVTAMVAVAQKA